MEFENEKEVTGNDLIFNVKFYYLGICEMMNNHLYSALECFAQG